MENYALSTQTDRTRCLICELPEDRSNSFVAVCTPRRGLIHWIHRGACHERHSARCEAEREAARAAQQKLGEVA